MRRDRPKCGSSLAALRLLLSISLLLLLLPVLTPQAQTPPISAADQRYTLLGKIGQSYLVRMDLEQDGETLRGGYFYERAGVVRPGSNRINLSGQIDSEGQITMVEMTAADGSTPQRTGEFVGKLGKVLIDGEPQLYFSGTWTRERDGRKLPFNLQELGEFRQVFGTSRLTVREQREENRSLNYTIRLNLPNLGEVASGFNRHLAAIVDPLVTEFKKDVAELRRDDQGRGVELPPSSLEIDYLMVQATPQLLSLQLTIYSYTGGAHPNGQTRSLNWDPRRERSLVLADLFSPGAPAGRIIADYCRRELARLDLGDPQWVARGTAFNDQNYQRWNPTRAGLRLTFDPYQVAAYVQGSFEVVVPWSLLRPHLRPGLLFISDNTPQSNRLSGSGDAFSVQLIHQRYK